MGPVQRQEYLYYSFKTGKQNAAYSNGFSIQAMPVSYACFTSAFFPMFLTFVRRSAIIFPQERQLIVHSGSIEVKGWSYSGDAHWIERVEVSSDGYVLP